VSFCCRFPPDLTPLSHPVYQHAYAKSNGRDALCPQDKIETKKKGKILANSRIHSCILRRSLAQYNADNNTVPVSIVILTASAGLGKLMFASRPHFPSAAIHELYRYRLASYGWTSYHVVCVLNFLSFPSLTAPRSTHSY
jgi:hypothetical protein